MYVSLEEPSCRHLITHRSPVTLGCSAERSVMSHEHDPLYSRPTFQLPSPGHRLTHTLLRFCPGSDASCWAVTGRRPGWRLEDGLVVAAAASGCFREVVTLIDWVTAASQGTRPLCVCMCDERRGSGWEEWLFFGPPPQAHCVLTLSRKTNRVHLWQPPFCHTHKVY